jgi:multimeric flavodoxin WrbA
VNPLAGDTLLALTASEPAADAVILGSPTRYGNVPAQLKQFLDSLGGGGSGTAGR